MAALPLDRHTEPGEPASTIAAIRAALPEELRGQFQGELDEAIDQALKQDDKGPVDRFEAHWLAHSQPSGSR